LSAHRRFRRNRRQPDRPDLQTSPVRRAPQVPGQTRQQPEVCVGVPTLHPEALPSGEEAFTISLGAFVEAAPRSQFGSGCAIS